MGISDIAVGGGTLLLAIFTARLASITTRLDERNAARARKRRERQVRGVARLVDGELAVVKDSLERAAEQQMWFVNAFALPTGAWDRDGALIAETVAEDEADALIGLFSRLRSWRTMVEATYSDLRPGVVPNLVSQQIEVINDMLNRLADARRYLRALAWPDARDLEPDPDSELDWRRERRRKRRQRALHPWRSV